MCYIETLTFSCGCQSINTYLCRAWWQQRSQQSADIPNDEPGCFAALSERIDISWPCSAILPGGNLVLGEDILRHLGPEPDLGIEPFYDGAGRLHRRKI